MFQATHHHFSVASVAFGGGQLPSLREPGEHQPPPWTAVCKGSAHNLSLSNPRCPGERSTRYDTEKVFLWR